MARISCFSAFLVPRKKKSKDTPKALDAKKEKGNGDLRVKPEEFVVQFFDKYKDISVHDESVSFGNEEKSFLHNMKVIGDATPVRTKTAGEAAYEGGDEQDDILSMSRNYSDFDLQARAEVAVELNSHSHDSIGSVPGENSDRVEVKSERDETMSLELMIRSGHVSDPGVGQKTTFWDTPSLKRSCSNIETRRASRLLESPKRASSYDDLQNLSGNFAKGAPNCIQGSPLSAMTSFSADRVMLKKRSSSQVLPSRSRKLWWKLFLWSHRNLHKPSTSKPQTFIVANDVANPKDGYTTDTFEASPPVDKKNKKVMEETQNQWFAFSAESSSLDRVNAWVNSLEDGSFCPDDNEGNENGDEEAAGTIVCPNSAEYCGSSGKNPSQSVRHAFEEIAQANNIIQSLNTFSSVAHISGMGLKIIPTISAFSSLRAVNLSSNFIVHISPGSLPKSLHTLDLSRNKIANIEGLRELTRLRILNLSYNRISRIGQGLSNCTGIKELYLSGNKISDVEGLHRLLKLTILDLSFNKIITAKALGQLVANYNSLLALNLLGNPIQSNIGDDQLRKAVLGLLPQLAYLNKQPIKTQRAREVATNDVAKAALGNSRWSSRKKSVRRVSASTSSAKSRVGEVSSHRGLGSGSGQKSSRYRSKNKHQNSTSGRK
ncbi:uncharacterized protein [Typha angustifolia]|uniref:uncharacterized protein n=1 Tax=Typha angustifolia TaxID=59011 RepID=UPI003C2D69BB